ncbi:MAG: hypothetical protein LBQ50_10270 [Planctomycetaceae bacterium]|jgi:hypothetical protein|nr:hypothetical protein [Planctomycetaceae bacterium]
MFLLTGCGSEKRAKPAGLPDLVPCVLTFVQEGTPIEGASIILRSSDPSFKWGVGGSTDAKGEVKLQTNGFYDGAPEGDYVITVSKIFSTGPPAPDSATLPKSEEEQNKVYSEIRKKTKQMKVVDPKFEQNETTPLKVTITKGKTYQSFDLGKPVNINIPIID